MWRNFKFQYIGDYMLRYVLSEDALIADVFQMLWYNS